MRIAASLLGLFATAAVAVLLSAPHLLQRAEAGPPVSLPDGWPLPHVAPPDGSLPAQLSEPQLDAVNGLAETAGALFNAGTVDEGRAWSVNFVFEDGWDAYVAAMEPGLLKRGYYLYWEAGGEGREYISKSGRHIVQLLWFPEVQTYKLGIMQYTNPWPHAEPSVANT